MLKDITIGQYFPGGSVLHRMDPRMKIILTMLYIVALFVADNAQGLLLCGALAAAGYLISGIPLSMLRKSMKPVLPIICFTAVLNMLFVEGETLVALGFLRITREGVVMAVLMVVRIVCLIAGS